MSYIITRGLRPKYSGLMTGIRGWSTQPSLVEVESILTNQETLEKELAVVTLKINDKEGALFSNKKKRVKVAKPHEAKEKGR